MNNVSKEIAYSTQSNAQKLDIYLPSHIPGPYPVIVWFHPGGYTMGDKTMVEPVLGTLLKRGYAVVSANYRLANEVCFPAQLFDAKAAVRWIKANAATYGFNRKAIAAWGVSAGSTFAALLGTSANVEELEDLSMGNPNETSHVNAVVDIIGPIDLLQIDSQLMQLGYEPIHGTPASGIYALIGGQPTKFPDRCKAVNPITYLTTDCPPFYLQHGTADHVVPYLQSVNFAKALIDTIGKEKVMLNLLENVDHFDSEHNSPENIQKALDFLERYIKPS
jgi:acetyl esterase/lipase